MGEPCAENFTGRFHDVLCDACCPNSRTENEGWGSETEVAIRPPRGGYHRKDAGETRHRPMGGWGRMVPPNLSCPRGVCPLIAGGSLGYGQIGRRPIRLDHGGVHQKR